MANISATFASDSIESIGEIVFTTSFGGLFRSDDILQFGNKVLTAESTPNVIAISFVDDEQLLFNASRVSRLPLVVSAGGLPQTPKYFVG